MFTEYTPYDSQRLLQARLERFRCFVITDLQITIKGCCLILSGIDPGTINVTQIGIDGLLYQAAIILGTSKIKILDTDSNLVLTAELKSEEPPHTEEAMAAATVARSGAPTNSANLSPNLRGTPSVEFDVTPAKELPLVVSHVKIIGITGETEQELRSRLQANATPFYWTGDSWGVDEVTASELIVQFRAEQGRREAAMLLGNEELPANKETNGRNKTATSKTEESDPSATQSPEFRPLKRGAGPTLEKYLSFVTNSEAKQNQMLADIIDETTKGKRHVNVILKSYPGDMDKPKSADFHAAAKRLMAKRKVGAAEAAAPNFSRKRNKAQGSEEQSEESAE